MEEPFAEDGPERSLAHTDAGASAVAGATGQAPQPQRGAPPPSIFQTPPQNRSLSEPFSRPTMGLLWLWMANAILIGLSVGLALSHGNWGAGARGIGFACLSGCVICVAGAVVRALRGRRGRHFVTMSVLVTLLLGSVGTLAVLAAQPVQGAQGHYFESRREWARAAQAYQGGGQALPDNRDAARVYVAWGEERANHQDYTAAIPLFVEVTTVYYASGAETSRARSDLISAAQAWLTGAPTDSSYAAVIPVLARARLSGHCAASCVADLGAIESRARYTYGLQLESERTVTASQGAIQQFEALIAQFGNTPLTAEAVGAAARTYYELGQLQQTSDCRSAIQTYQTLTKVYPQTPEAAAAAASLAAPVPISGALQETSGAPPTTLDLYLSKNVTSPSADDFSQAFFSRDYRTTPDSSGRFTFSAVAPGSYNLSSVIDGQVEFPIVWYNKDPLSFYTIQIPPVCPADIGVFTYSR